MQPKKFLISLSLILPLLLISACESVPVIKTEKVETTYIAQPHPKGIVLSDIHFHVVTTENLQQFKEDLKAKEDAMVFMALTVKDYENMSVNVAEVKRYIDQQNALIEYYEGLLNKKDINSSKP